MAEAPKNKVEGLEEKVKGGNFVTTDGHIVGSSIGLLTSLLHETRKRSPQLVHSMSCSTS